MSDSAPPPPPPENPAGGASTPPPPPPPPADGPTGQMPPPPPASPYGQPAPPMSGGQMTGPHPAGLLDRFLARLIDGILVFVVNLVIALVILGAIFSSGGGAGYFSTGQSFAYTAVSAIISAALYLGYFAFMESSRGQTVGKMLMKLHTQGPDGGKPTMEQALRRNAWSALGILGVIPIVGGFIAFVLELVAVIMIAVGINSDAVGRQAWHDKFAGGTRVIKEG